MPQTGKSGREPDILRFKGNYRTGSGRASGVFKSVHRVRQLRELFGCSLIGTFNIALPKGPHHNLLHFPASYEVSYGDVRWWWYLCEIQKQELKRKAWILRWASKDKNHPGGYLEVASRRALPDEFRTGNLLISVFVPWSRGRTESWLVGLGDFKWFQKFDWCPGRKDGRPRSDSGLVWNTIRPCVKWELSNVLDIGCHTGYYAVQAARLGAIVSACDPNRGALGVAETITRHVEKVDVDFHQEAPGGRWDTILYLSVQHQWDPTYSALRSKIAVLRGRCKDLFVELIVPPLQGNMKPEEVDRAVGGTMLLDYKHNIRGRRRVYHVKGS